MDLLTLAALKKNINNSNNSSGGGSEIEPFVINGEIIQDEQYAIVSGQLDKTWNEIKQAIIERKVLYYNLKSYIVDTLVDEVNGTDVFVRKSKLESNVYEYQVSFAEYYFYTNIPDEYPQISTK